MFGALKRGFRSMAHLILVRNVVGELRPKRTLAASRGFLAAARLSCLLIYYAFNLHIAHLFGFLKRVCLSVIRASFDRWPALVSSRRMCSEIVKYLWRQSANWNQRVSILQTRFMLYSIYYLVANHACLTAIYQYTQQVYSSKQFKHFPWSNLTLSLFTF